jgi:hypothetical protein
MKTPSTLYGRLAEKHWRRFCPRLVSELEAKGQLHAMLLEVEEKTERGAPQTKGNPQLRGQSQCFPVAPLPRLAMPRILERIGREGCGARNGNLT